MEWVASFSICLIVSGLAGYMVAHFRRRRDILNEERIAEARRDFRFQRERLEAKFIDQAKRRIDPANWLWDDAQFDDEVAFARHRYTGELTAYAAVTVERVRPDILKTLAGSLSHIRSATVVFEFDGERWQTHGRAILNLSPDETVHLYQRELQLLKPEPATAGEPLESSNPLDDV